MSTFYSDSKFRLIFSYGCFRLSDVVCMWTDIPDGLRGTLIVNDGKGEREPIHSTGFLECVKEDFYRISFSSD